MVVRAKRDLLLRVYRYQLRHEDLEDCYSQATLELLAHVRGGGSFTNRLHMGNAIELRFLSRVRDRRRALAGRSPMQAALETAVSLDIGKSDVEIVDGCAEVEKLVMLRLELRDIGSLARRLSRDQRLVLASQLAQESCGSFCERSGWSPEKYRKVAQRGRARLRRLMAHGEPSVPLRQRASDEGAGTRL